MNPINIILAEPSELLSKVLSDRLEMDGYKVINVKDGIQLVEEIEKGTGDIIVAEELLPYKSGFEIIENAKNKSIPVIIISDADLEDKILEAFDLGAVDFIDKPFSPNEVSARIKNALKQKSKS